MELNDVQSLERLTGLAFFRPANQTAFVPLGNIEMLKLDYGLKSVDILRARRGQVYPRKRHYYGRTPVFTIQGNQFATPARFLQLCGTRLTNWSQLATTGAMYTFTAVAGGAWPLGKYSALIQSVKVGSSVKIQDYDYFLDGPDRGGIAHNGWIWIPVNGGTIVAGDTVVVTFDCPALSVEQYTALDTLSVDGYLVVTAEDEFGPPGLETWQMNVTLSCRAMPDTDPVKYRSYTYEVMIYDKPQVFKRGEAGAFLELLTDTGAVLDLS